MADQVTKTETVKVESVGDGAVTLQPSWSKYATAYRPAREAREDVLVGLSPGQAYSITFVRESLKRQQNGESYSGDADWHYYWGILDVGGTGPAQPNLAAPAPLPQPRPLSEVPAPRPTMHEDTDKQRKSMNRRTALMQAVTHMGSGGQPPGMVSDFAELLYEWLESPFDGAVAREGDQGGTSDPHTRAKPCPLHPDAVFLANVGGRDGGGRYVHYMPDGSTCDAMDAWSEPIRKAREAAGWSREQMLEHVRDTFGAEARDLAPDEYALLEADLLAAAP